MPVITRIITELSGSSRKPQSSGECRELAVGHVERQAGDPGELDHLMAALFRGSCASCHTAPTEKMNDSRTIPGQISLIRNFSGESWWWRAMIVA